MMACFQIAGKIWENSTAQHGRYNDLGPRIAISVAHDRGNHDMSPAGGGMRMNGTGPHGDVQRLRNASQRPGARQGASLRLRTSSGGQRHYGVAHVPCLPAGARRDTVGMAGGLSARGATAGNGPNVRLATGQGRARYVWSPVGWRSRPRYTAHAAAAPGPPWIHSQHRRKHGQRRALDRCPGRRRPPCNVRQPRECWQKAESPA